MTCSPRLRVKRASTTDLSMARVIHSPRAKADVTDVLRYTKGRWGKAKAIEYRELIRDALSAIAKYPGCGKSRSEVRPGVFSYHIKQPGRNARHVVFYRLRADGVVEFLRLLHDAMDFDRHLP
jgi:toxin ParE1/3/4